MYASYVREKKNTRYDHSVRLAIANQSSKNSVECKDEKKVLPRSYVSPLDKGRIDDLRGFFTVFFFFGTWMKKLKSLENVEGRRKNEMILITSATRTESCLGNVFTYARFFFLFDLATYWMLISSRRRLLRRFVGLRESRRSVFSLKDGT